MSEGCCKTGGSCGGGKKIELRMEMLRPEPGSIVVIHLPDNAPTGEGFASIVAENVRRELAKTGIEGLGVMVVTAGTKTYFVRSIDEVKL